MSNLNHYKIASFFSKIILFKSINEWLFFSLVFSLNTIVIKVALYGDSAVGKSAINSFLVINLKDEFLITVGIEKSKIKYKVKNNEEIKLIICYSGGF